MDEQALQHKFASGRKTRRNYLKEMRRISFEFIGIAGANKLQNEREPAVTSCCNKIPEVRRLDRIEFFVRV